MVPDFALEIKPLAVRQQHAEGDYLAHHHFTDSVEIAATIRKVGHTSGMAFIFTLPNRIEVHTQPGSRSSFIHGPEAIINFLLKRAKKNLKRGSGATDAQSFGNDLESGRKPSWKFSIDFQIDLCLASCRAHRHFPC
jgi:hypothetical protein